MLDSRLISVAILNQEIDGEKLQKIQNVLIGNFSHFEILLINPIFNFITPPLI